MTLINIGTDPEGHAVSLDLETLAEQRLLVQGTSGSGKSGLLRRLLEQSYGKIPQVVIDTEGEFATLRAKYPDYVLAAHEGGDTLAAPHTASKLCREINALNVSAILDISELDPRPRLEFVANYLTTLVNLPRGNWKPVLLVIDEAHEFAPENGSAVSLLPVERVASKGRKRGIVLIAATTRVSDLSKSVTALTNNKLIGKTQQDIDVRRAAFELAIAPREATAQLRNLKSRNFIGFGGAFRFKGYEGDNFQMYVADTTTHPPAAGELVAPKAPTARMRKALAKLSDLPKEAEREVRDLAEAKVEIARLGRELAGAIRRGAAVERVTVTEPCGHDMRALEARAAELEAKVGVLETEAQTLGEAVGVARDALVGNAHILDQAVKEHAGRMKRLPKVRANVPQNVPTPPVRAASEAPAPVSRPMSAPVSNGDLSGPWRKILDAMGRLHAFGIKEMPLPSVAAHANRSSRGRFQTTISELATAGYLTRIRKGFVSLTDAGHAAATVEPIRDVADYRARWLSVCNGPQRAILESLIASYPNAVTVDALAESIGRSPAGRFQTTISEVCTMGAATRPSRGMVQASPLLFPEGLE